MNHPIVDAKCTVLLVGGGALARDVYEQSLKKAEIVVAADGGAARVLEYGRLPDAVIGDLDSLSQANRMQLPPKVLHPIAEQDSTDFDKCLRNISAPLILGHGFLGARLDHQLAAMTVLGRRADKRCVLVGESDVVLLAPPALSLDLPVGSRFSLYPLGPVTGRSTGLRWPIDGLAFSPDGIVGTSNEVTGPVRITFDDPRMLLILPLEALRALLAALAAEPSRWSARA